MDEVIELLKKAKESLGRLDIEGTVEAETLIDNAIEKIEFNPFEAELEDAGTIEV